MSLKISMTVNGKPVSGDIEPRTLLVDFIRDTLRLTQSDYTIGCPLCFSAAPRPRAANTGAQQP